MGPGQRHSGGSGCGLGRGEMIMIYRPISGYKAVERVLIYMTLYRGMQ